MPEMKKFMEKRISIKMNAARVVSGRLRGYDHFMNVVLDEAVEEVSAADKREIGLVVSAARAASGGGRSSGYGNLATDRGSTRTRRERSACGLPPTPPSPRASSFRPVCTAHPRKLDRAD